MGDYEYVIYVTPYPGLISKEYLQNKTYRVAGEKYIIFTREDDATRYSSENRAVLRTKSLVKVVVICQKYAIKTFILNGWKRAQKEDK